jgi:hypothetical protein
MAQHWGRYCTQRNGIDHVATFSDDEQCPFCKLANPTPPVAPARTPPQRAATIIDLSGDTPPARTSGGVNFASLGGSAAQEQRRRSIAVTQHQTRSRTHAGSSALGARQAQAQRLTGVSARHFNINVQIVSGRFEEDPDDGGKKYTREWIKQGKFLLRPFTP